MRRQLPVSSPVTLSGLWHGVRGALAIDPEPTALSAELAASYGARLVALCDSGTSALVLALRALVPRGGTIALPSYGCVDLAAAARYVGARVRLYDLDPSTLSVDADSLACALGRGVDAVVAVHLYGVPLDMPLVRRIVDECGVPLIEDAAQAAGSVLHGRAVGSFGDLSILSFGRGKGTTGGRGGAVMALNAAAAERLRPLTARVQEPRGAGWGDLTRAAAQWLLGRPTLYALPSAMPGLRLGEMVYHPAHEPQAMSRGARALVRVARGLDAGEVERRRRHAIVLRAAMLSCPAVRAIEPIAGAEPGYLRFPVLDTGVLAPAPALGITRGYPQALFEQPELQPCLHRDEAEPLGGRHLRECLFTLPVHGLLTEQDLANVRAWLASANN